MRWWTWVLLGVLVVLIAVLVVLYIFGKRNQKKQEEQNEEMKKTAQNMSFYIIDMKKLRLKDAGLPKIVLESATRLSKLGKLPILKVKVTNAGGRINNTVMSLVCDPEVYKTLLPKQEVKAQVSGIYVMSAKRVRGPVYEPKKHKKKTERLLDKLR